MTTGNSEPLLDAVRRLYRDSLRAHGVDAKAVGWTDPALQRLRFEYLARVVDPAVAAFSVNDLGCGYGAMFDFFAERDPRLESYVGVDISSEMIEAARQRVSDPRATFVESNALPRLADYSFACGTFNVKMDAADERWTAFVESTLVDIARQSRKGFAFNLLSTYVDWRNEHLYYADPCRFFDFCKRRLSKSVTLLHDYPLYEWTILVRK